ncbi:MAG: PEGA domain-containing protein, partial [Deltaproteobacteria bacterium]|nr:PEGA domain-containing protein [Deltaproteobacteria bacterium]
VIRGARRGKTHSITLKLDGYQDYSTSVNLDSDSKSVSASLKSK